MKRSKKCYACSPLRRKQESYILEGDMIQDMEGMFNTSFMICWLTIMVRALSHYQNLGLKDKIVILKGYSEIAYDLRNLTFRTLSSDGLFMQEKIDSEVQGSPQAPIVHPPAPIVISPTRSQNSVTSSYASAATLAVPLATPKQRSPSPGHTRRASRDAGRGQRRIDTSKVCSPSCGYSHS